jgi:hypothetical protein
MLPESEVKTVLSRLDKLWSREEERNFFQKVKDFGYQHACDKFRSQKLVLEDLSVELSSVPARFLPVVCALDQDGQVKPTSVGRIIKNLDIQLREKGIEASFILVSGAAKEAVSGAKPFCKTRTSKEGSLSLEKYDCSLGKPMLDGDFLLVSSELNEEIIKEIVMSLPKENGLKIKFKQSKSRSFTMIEVVGIIPETFFDWQQRERRCSVAQISAPEFRGYNSFENPFIASIVSGDTNYRHVLVMPTETSEGFVGVEMNFFPVCQKTKIFFEQKNYEGKQVRRSLRVAFIPNFEEAFPLKDSPSEAFVHYCHFLRDITWDNHLRLILGSSSLSTSLTIAHKVVYPLARDPSLIIKDTTSMLHHTNRLFEGMKKLLDGDPYLGLIYMLSAGENPTSAPVYGTGLIDQKGFFPELYYFLHQNKRIDKLVSIMETCDYGAAGVGWSTFVSFIYEETGKDLRRVDRLLCPVFCSNKVFPTLVDNYVRKALSKFYSIPLRNPCTGAFPKH